MALLEGLLGKKLGMTQIFSEDGQAVPVTAIQVGPCTVLQIRTPEKDGYSAVQIGFQPKKKSRVTQPEEGHAKKAKAAPMRYVREVAFLGAPDKIEPGQSLTAQIFEGARRVDVTGVNKGRGFAGVMKRWNFRGGDKTHGSKSHRRPGSVGMHTFPSRVLKGQRMSGHWGNERTTVRNIEVVRLDPSSGLLFLGGGVPGPNGGFLLVRRSQAERRAAGAAGKAS